jgi:adenosylcobinamide-GDP ribazoletransferase
VRVFAPVYSAFLAAFAFLTRLPVTRAPLRDVELGRSVAVFPAVGIVLGLVLTGLAFGLAGVLPPFLTAVFLVALLGALTGGIHLDGFADVFDAVGGGRGDRIRMLGIMRDSRIGAHGAAALTLLLVAKVLAVGYLIEGNDLVSLLVFPAIGRWAVTPLIAFLPYAREEGLGRAFRGNAGPKQVAIAAVIATIPTALLGLRMVVPALVATAVVGVFGLWMKRHLGGLTGDVYGAAIELGELVVLVALLV